VVERNRAGASLRGSSAESAAARQRSRRARVKYAQFLSVHQSLGLAINNLEAEKRAGRASCSAFRRAISLGGLLLSLKLVASRCRVKRQRRTGPPRRTGRHRAIGPASSDWAGWASTGGPLVGDQRQTTAAVKAIARRDANWLNGPSLFRSLSMNGTGRGRPTTEGADAGI
jgi:hypothetical protein